ncbi:hypothetical protein TUM19329_02780 [Legionella antarctica]|uniref:Uncharacterized protein n=1 Tax=Legionella antarctica TaxID=2708020 RepID=A0A6F8T169_9GAMM|nr:hypothetical protein [Legionella antarctica]BCA93917.1 hypothetical protein TUM19329_02780 [Legionella antarctica]
MIICAWIYNYACTFLNLIWAIISSPIFIAAILAPIFAIKTYLKQQRVSRIQRIYYEESLLDQLKHLDNAIDLTSKNLAYFENAINLILNDLKVGAVTIATITSLNEIAKKIEAPTLYQVSKREILIILFKKHGYIAQQWLFKYDNDFSSFNLHVREVISGLATELLANPSLQQTTITAYAQEIKDNYNLIMRHFTFAYLFNLIVSRVGVLDFKSQKTLINDIAKDCMISSTLIKIDKVFKILFGYFKITDKTFLSYLEDENGDRFKFNIDQQITITKVKQAPPPEDQLRIIKNDLRLAQLKIEVNNLQKHYSFIQIEMANLCSFDEKPQFYREAESFDTFK